MIGTVVRHGRSRRDTKNLVAHLLKDPGAKVEISGSMAPDLAGALREMEIARDGSRADSAYLHISLSPSRAMGRDELRQMADIVLRHLGAEDHRHSFVIHPKERTGGAGDRHAHLVLGRVGPDGTVLPAGFEIVRLETAMRLAEFEMGEPATLGRHHESSARWLRKNGRADVADWLDAAHGPSPEKPSSTTTPAKRQALARAGVSLPEAREAVRAAWAASDSAPALRAALAEQGFDVVAGAKPGVWIVRSGETEIGSLDRLAKVKRGEVAARMQEVPSVRPVNFVEAALAADRAADFRKEAVPFGKSAYGDAPRGSGGSSGHGEPPAAPRLAGAAGGRERPLGRDQGTPRPDPARDAAPAARDRGSDGPDRGAEGRQAARRHVRRAAAVARLGKADITDLLKQARELGLSPADRAKRDLANLRAEAQAKLARATAPVPEPPSLKKAQVAAAATKAESTKGFDRSTAAEKAVAAVEQQEPRGLFAFFRRPAWRRAVADAKAKHEATRVVWRDASEAHANARRELDRETQRATRDRLSAEAKAKPAADKARSDLDTIERAEALLQERPGLARHGLDAVMELARRQLLEEERRRLEEDAARRRAASTPSAPEREPPPPAFRFG